MLLLTNWRRMGGKRDRRVWPGNLGTRNERGEKLVEFCKMKQIYGEKYLVQKAKTKKKYLE